MFFDSITRPAGCKNSRADQAPTITYSYATNRNATLWHPRAESLPDFDARFTEHEPARRPQGPTVVLADLIKGQRLKTAVKSVSALALDVTTGRSTDSLVGELDYHPGHAILFTGFDHGRTETLFSKDSVYRRLLRWKHPEVDQVGVVRYFREVMAWDETILETVAYVGDRQTADGLMIVLRHSPFPMHTIIIPVVPFAPTQVAATHAEGIAKWGQVARNINASLGLPDNLSRDALDPARIVFLPRCRDEAEGDAEPEAMVFDGPLTDWRDFDLTPPPEKPKGPNGPTFDAIKAVIGGGVESPVPVLEMIAKLDSEPERESLFKSLAKVVGGSVVAMRKAVAAIRSSDDGDADGVVTLDDGHRVLVHSGRVDQVEAREFVKATMQGANADSLPNYSQNLGSVMALRRHSGKLTFEALSSAGFQAEVSKRCSFSEHREGAPMIRDLPDSAIVSTVFEALDPGDLPAQPTIRRAPTIGADGGLLDRDGWHGDVLVDLGDLKVPTVPLKPTQGEITAARDFLMGDVLGDFPFDDGCAEGAYGESPASRANAVAMIVTPFVRDLFSGPSPVFGVIAPSAGSGKTLLATVPQILADGRAAATTANSGSEEEWSKQVVAICQGDSGFVFIDNARALDSPTVLRTTTSDWIGGRLLGMSRNVERRNTLQWIFTGVNPRLSAEMARRTVFVNLNTRTAVNEDRTYRHADYDAWLKDQRGEIIAAVLTLARAWVAQGSKPSEAKLPSFTSWAATIGGILKAAGVEGFLTNKRAPRADREGSETTDFITAWWEQKGGGDVNDGEAFSLADGMDSAMVTGFGPERRQNFLTKLDGLRGRTFDLADATVMLAVTDDGWRLVMLAKREAKK